MPNPPAPPATGTKLVRDLVPELLRAEGRTVVTHVADGEEFHRRLRAKLQEEVDEFLEAESVEELADVVEVVLALAGQLGCSPAELEEHRRRKAEARGGFERRLISRVPVGPAS